MAVTESKGNGYALYNGVKLPNIDTVWTEELKQTHPYVGIADLSPNLYALYIVDDIPTTGHNDTYGSTLALQAGTEGKLYILANTQEAADVLGISEANVWTWTEDMIAKEGDYICTIDLVAWASHDILNEDGTTYLSASDPIPLDGMNVIEWDGDTTGLESYGDVAYYKVCDYSYASNAVAVITLTDGSLNVATNYDGEGDESIDAGWAVVGLDTAVVGFIDKGIYLLCVDGGFCSLLAYTPATTEPEEPEEPDTPTVEKFPLMELIMGILSELNAGVYYTGGDD